MSIPEISFLSETNRNFLSNRDKLIREFKLSEKSLFFWRPCTVNLLIVADGLDFNPANGFGLSTFVSVLLDAPWYVRFRITLAHMGAVGAGSPQMMPTEPAIANRIPAFKFDNAAHFAPAMYDVVFLFGIAATYNRGVGYPADSLSNAELQVLAQFQNAGGGLFATGDHGALGKAMCHKVARARNMRYWESTFDQAGEDRVSMAGRYRNDTNRLGNNAISDFNDQSDDIPQPISPVFYSRRSGIFRYSFPHPILCGPNGAIRVMPDHAHEGECRVPENVELNLNFTGPLGKEYPAATDGGAKPVPEVVSYNSVLSGTTSGGKQPTVSQRFPGISAYDGHRAGVGRVVTDATWHHFVNVNLIGEAGAPVGDPKRLGFLATPTGEAHFEEIKAYYRNLAIWLSPPARIHCMNARLLWHLVMSEHVLESVLTAREIGLSKVKVHVLALIGRHARDVLGRYASRCQSVRLIIDILQVRPKLIPEIDPWRHPWDERVDLDDDDLPMFDVSPMLDAALGGALVAINEAFGDVAPDKFDKLDERKVLQAAIKGAGVAMERAEVSFKSSFEKAGRILLN